MTKPRNRTPIESFGAPLFNALIEGSKRKIEVETTYRNAVKFRMRVHQLRFRMREENHPLASIAAKTRVTIFWHPDTPVVTDNKKTHAPKNPDATVTLQLAPQDSEFGDIFKKIGLDLTTPIDHQLLGAPASAEGGGEGDAIPTLEDLFKDFK